MRQIASFLLIALALPATAAETWRWKDANGVVHYSDRPVPGAERMNLGSGTTPDAQPVTVAPRAGVGLGQQTSAPIPYSSCTVVAPANDETFNMVNSVSATLQVTPILQVGHRLRVLLDGVVHVEWPDRQLSNTLMNVYRGTHTLSVQVLDADGKTVCAGPATTFHVRQSSIFSPARQPTARP
jgi:Domain of unknown function (DUF4124)